MVLTGPFHHEQYSALLAFEFGFLEATRDFPGGSDSKASANNAGDPGSNPGSGRSPGEGNGNPFQYSYLGNPTGRSSWQARVHGVVKVKNDLVTKQ